jgi:hypothetical protein
VAFKLRLYPEHDEDLIRWLESRGSQPYGGKTWAVKEALRRGIAGTAERPIPTAGVAPALDLGEIRQVVEAAVASALGRLAHTMPGEGQVSGATTSAAPQEDQEVEDLLQVLEQALVLQEKSR